jgi:kynurenine 3-monooxygenase
MSKVIIVGAGLAGSLLAIYLARRGFEVDVYESRGDMRKEEIAAGRSINLALSDRGIAALREVGMDEYMLAEAVPMYGRMIHDPLGGTKLLPYSGRKGEYISSISRAGLNIALINEAEKYVGVRFHFNDGCVDFDCDSGAVRLASGRAVNGDSVIATDGAGSAIRQAVERQMPGFGSSSVLLEHGYKELQIPPAKDGDSKFSIEPSALHIWPRHQFMMIALPNFDGSFTCTLFLDKRRLSEMENESDVVDFFNREFPDAVRLMPTLVEDFFHNPVGELGTMKCWPWRVDGKVLLLGDAAHAMVPFYGQGMNCAFEDVRVLDSLLSEPPASAGGQIDWKWTFKRYSELRKPNTDAIQDLAEENFYEMRDATADPVFQRKRQLETRLEQEFPDYYSKYSMVTFREDLPYETAKRIGNKQDEILMSLCADPETTREIPLARIFEIVKRETGITV